MSSPAPLVSIVIPVYNQLPFVLKCLTAISENTDLLQSEIILVDDASPEFNLPDLIRPPARVLRNSANKGFAATCNAGALAARGSFLCFLNSDTEPRARWLEPMLSAFNDASVGLVGPKLLFPDGTVQSCGGLYDGGRGPFHRHLGYAGTHHMVNKPGYVSWITGACHLIPTRLFYELGGYDEGYKRGYFEDVDLCERVKAAGYRVWYEPASVVTHHAGASGNTKTREESRKSAHSFHRNSLRFHARWDAVIKPDTQNVMVNY